MEQAFKAASRSGIKPDCFFDLTPYQTGIYVGESIEKYGDDCRADLYLAWHVAAFSRTKRLPPLKKLIEVKPKGSGELSSKIKAVFSGLEAKGVEDDC